MPGQYPLHPGTVGWKTGFRFYRDELLGFDRTRLNIFRYAFFVHALGLPQSEEQFLRDGTTANPLFHTPRTNSGVGDWAGGDVMVSLGAFDDANGLPVGSALLHGRQR